MATGDQQYSMSAELQRALREVRDTLLREPVSPAVEEPADINLHYCRYVARSVVEAVDDDAIDIVEDGGKGYVHTWIHCDGRHYDAECIEGVEDYHQLPFFQRHPEAAMHVEPVTTDPGALRNRGGGTLYPPGLTPGRSERSGRTVAPSDKRWALAAMLGGILLVSISFGGEWAIRQYLLQVSASMQALLVDLELIGFVVLLAAPVVFLFIRPAHRASVP